MFFPQHGNNDAPEGVLFELVVSNVESRMQIFLLASICICRRWTSTAPTACPSTSGPYLTSALTVKI